MADDEGKTGGEGEGSDEFDPKALDPKVQESLRRYIQSESNKQTAVVEKRLQDEQVSRNRSAVETAESNELRQLAESGQHEALGLRVATRLTEQSAEAKAIGRASDFIEEQMANKFSESLGPERVEQIRRQVASENGAHAEFAEALAKASGGESRAKEIQAEVKAQLMEARGEKRDAAAGPDTVSGAGQGTKLSEFDDLEQDYVDGKVKREAYAAAKEARDKGQ